jgi:hypothetical protein
MASERDTKAFYPKPTILLRSIRQGCFDLLGPAKPWERWRLAGEFTCSPPCLVLVCPTPAPLVGSALMSLTETDRLANEVRELLYKTRNKEQVTRVLQGRGMDPDEARQWVRAIHKDNLWTNRKTSLGAIIGAGLVVVILTAIWIFTGRLFVVWLPLSVIALLWGIVKFLTASGYEIEDDD